MRLLWLSNAPWSPSGYGEQTALFTRRLRDAGHDVAILCNYGLEGRETLFDGITCYPSDRLWGNSNLATFAKRHGAEQIVALCDAWVLNPEVWPELNVAIWTPIDHYPIPPPVLGVLQHERVTPLAMSRFGEQQMLDCDLSPLYVPHGVDTRIFRPQPEIRDAVRDELQIPRDVFLIGMVAANTSGPVSRKSFPQAFLAFSRFAKQHEDAWLYAHTQATSRAGIALDTLAEACDCPHGRLRFPHDEVWQIGMPSQTIAAIYQAFDVLLMPSMGEGFGIPLIEAQACGVPVIASHHSAMSENCGAGWLVGGDPWWDAVQQSFAISPSIDGIVAALEAAYASRDDQQLRDQAATWASAYDADVVAETYLRDALAQLGDQRERDDFVAVMDEAIA